jgi:hypothetical protein
LLAKLIRSNCNFVPAGWNNIIFRRLIAYDKNLHLPESWYYAMGMMTEYGQPGSGILPSAWNDRGGQLGSNSGKRQAGETIDPEFDSLTAALRQMHDSIANEPVPDDFLDLLDQIDAKISASKKLL